MRTRAPAALSRAARNRGRGRPPVVAVCGSYLGTRYPDEDVRCWAGQDGQILLQHPRLGETVNCAASSPCRRPLSRSGAVRLLPARRPARWVGSTRAVQEFRAGVISARDAQMAVAVEAFRLAMLRKKLAGRGLDPPAPAPGSPQRRRP